MGRGQGRSGEDARVLLLVHGFPLAAAMWQPQLDGLAAAGWRLLAPDLPGFGGNTAPMVGASMDEYADFLVALLDAQGIERAVVAGMSMGGYILLNLLARHRQRVAAAVFIATRAEGDDPAGKERRTRLAAAARAGRTAEVVDGFAEILFAPGTAAGRPELAEQVRGWMGRATPEGLAAALLAMRDRPDYSARLPGFDLPALVIGGAEDQLLGAASYRVLLDGLPRSSGCLIAGGGHLVNLEQPAAFNTCLRTFLERLPA